MKNKYRIDMVDAEHFNLTSAPCGMGRIMFLRQSAPRPNEVKSLLVAVPTGKALICSCYNLDKRDYLVYAAFVK